VRSADYAYRVLCPPQQEMQNEQFTRIRTHDVLIYKEN
jgi:hypothetical protein